MYYCIISLCTGGLKRYCNTIECMDELREHIMGYYFDESKLECEDKLEYVNHVINTIQVSHDKVLYFKRLSYNQSCCQLYMYCTNDSSRIGMDGEYQYINLTDEEENYIQLEYVVM